jgi:HlyD family secretion protein
MRQTLPKGITAPTDGAEHGNGAAYSEVASTTVVAAPSAPAITPQLVEEVRYTRRRSPWRIVLPIALVVAIALALAYLFLRPTTTVTTAVVTRGTIISSVETTGKLQADLSAKLSFRSSGTVGKVLAKQGDKVKAGDVLAELDTDALQRQLMQAQAQLEISKLKLQQAKKGPQPADIAAATANLNGAVAALNSVRAGGRAEDIAAAQALYNQAQSKLDALKKGPSATDLSAAQARLDQAKANRDAVVASTTNATEQARILLEQAKASTENWLDPAGKVEQARLNYDAAQQSQTAQVNAANAQVTEAQAALDKLKAGPTTEDLRQAQEALNQAKANLDKVKSGATPQEIAEAQSRVDAAQAALDKVKVGPADTDLAILEQQINLAQLSVDNASAQLADAQLTSPIAGTVLSIDLDVGEQVGAMQPIATVADTTSLRVKADVDEIDVGRVSVGQPVTVTLDSYPGVKMPGKIDDLAPGATLKQGSTVYQATISFTPAQGVTPREGMAASVDITAQRKDNVLLLPNRAFETVGRRQYVTLKEGDNTRKVEVETGLSNSTDTEVISGLREGQTVLLK